MGKFCGLGIEIHIVHNQPAIMWEFYSTTLWRIVALEVRNSRTFP